MRTGRQHFADRVRRLVRGQPALCALLLLLTGAEGGVLICSGGAGATAAAWLGAVGLVAVGIAAVLLARADRRGARLDRRERRRERMEAAAYLCAEASSALANLQRNAAVCLSDPPSLSAMRQSVDITARVRALAADITAFPVHDAGGWEVQDALTQTRTLLLAAAARAELSLRHDPAGAVLLATRDKLPADIALVEQQFARVEAALQATA